MESIIVVTKCERLSPYVKQHFELQHNRATKHKNIKEQTADLFEDDIISDDCLFCSKAMDDKQE